MQKCGTHTQQKDYQTMTQGAQRVWIATKFKGDGLSWDERPQEVLYLNDEWLKRAIKSRLQQEGALEVRLSNSAGYNNNGQYIYHTQV